MKNILLASVLTFVLSATAHTYQTDEYLSFIKQHGFWAMLEGSNKLVFCVGIDQNDKPACTVVPENYIVIELPKKLQ